MIRHVLSLGAALFALAPAARAESPAALDAAAAKALVAPFYAALNAGAKVDPALLIPQTMAEGWLSCAGNDDASCAPREKVIGFISGLHKTIPDLKWEITEVISAPGRIVVRGEGSGTPAGDFLGVPHGGKSFRLMSIDIHEVKDGKVTRSHHLEDWAAALRQLSAK